MKNEIHAAYDKHRRFKEAGNYVNYEEMLKATYSRLINHGDNVIDVGAADGFHALTLAQLVGSEGLVYAFEPLAADYGCWEKFLAEHQNLRLCTKAVADIVGDTHIYRYSVIGEVTGLSGLQPRKVQYDRAEYDIASPVNTEVTMLDTEFAALSALKYIKIDIEGGETDCVCGAVNLLKRLRPIVSFEHGSPGYSSYQYNGSEIAEIFGSLDYVLFDVLGTSLGGSHGLGHSLDECLVWDYWAVPKEIADQISQLLV